MKKNNQIWDTDFLNRLVDMLEQQLGKNTEIVLHDLRNGYEHTIVDIRNGNITGRKVGGTGSNLGLEVLKGTYGNGDRYSYVTKLPDGRYLRSSSLYIRDSNGNTIGCLCINTDITETLKFEQVLSGVIDKTAMVFGQMNEPPGARMRVALAGLTMAEYFRDRGGKDVLLFVDNIFRFTQAGSEVSALLGRMPSAVGYQPTLQTEMGALQERITSTKNGSITSVQAVYVPADDLTDPAPATTFAHLDATTVLERSIAELGIYPAVDPLASTSRILDPRIVGQEHFEVAHAVQEILQKYKELQDIVADTWVWVELSEEDKLVVSRARKVQRFLSQPFFVAGQFTGLEGKYVPIAETIRGFKEILEGKHDDVPESYFLNVGSIDEVRAKMQ